MIETVQAPDRATVLVTGGSGFLAGWVIVTLLRKGYRVRTTIRDLAREGHVRGMIANAIDPEDRLSFFAADLLKDEGWDRAIAGSDYVLHVASPMPIGEYRGQNVIHPAREGTRRVLEAAARAGVKRVVITSSASAASRTNGKTTEVDESIWTDLPAKKIYNYPRSKTLAEQDAWQFVRQLGAGSKLELTTVLPGQIQGPLLGAEISASAQIVQFIFTGKMVAIPRLGFSFVDVRDVSEFHVLAMTSAQAAGERFIASGGFLWFEDIARILRQHLGPRAAKVSTRRLPDLVVRVGALFNPEMAQLAPILGVRSNINTAKAERVLGWRTRPAETSIVDTIDSLLKWGLV